MADLKPCPFCGGAAIVRTTGGWSGIGCLTDKCPASLHALMFRAVDDAEATWNRRAASGAPASSNELPEGRNSQHVLKAEGASPDATDRENRANASPVGGPMGAGQADAAAPDGGEGRKP